VRILYVEDHAANLFLLQRIARMGNHEVINYTDGQTALDNFERDKPDLVLMDVQLEGTLSGLDVTEALRAAGHKTPIIAVTAYAMVGDRDRCLAAGCDGYIAKPMPVGELVEVIRRYESKSAAPAANTTAATPPAATAPTQASPAVTGTPTSIPAAPAASVQTVSPAEAKPADPTSVPLAPNAPPAETKPVDGAGASSSTTSPATTVQPAAPASNNSQTEATKTGENARDEKVVSGK
jgi:CheY-like chemotaxis protein